MDGMLCFPRINSLLLYIYNQVNGGINEGVFTPDVLKVLLDHGCATLADFPYNAGDFLSWPSDTAYSNAIPFRCDSAKQRMTELLVN